MIKILENINHYYTDKIKMHGATPKGVDWNGEESQFIRFEQLSKIINKDIFSINDIGCGYGKYFEYLQNRFLNFNYYGFDLSQEMIKNAKSLYSNKGGGFMQVDNLKNIEKADYSVASGIFSVKMEHNESEWLSLFEKCNMEIEVSHGLFLKPFTTQQIHSLNLDNIIYNSLGSTAHLFPEISNSCFFILKNKKD